MSDSRKDKPTPEERIKRMRESFEKDRSVLAEDYEHFTQPSTPDESSRPNKAVRKSGKSSGKRGPKSS